jgi:hypothetical protein
MGEPMDSPQLTHSTAHDILNQVREGMRVCDSHGDKIGTVRQLHLGEVSEAADERGQGAATVTSPARGEDSLLERLADVFSAGDRLPDTVRNRLLRQGFIRIAMSGLFARDRFALPDQIEAVSEDCVRLRVDTDALIEPG